MSGRVAVQCVALLLVLPLAGCGGATTSTPPVAPVVAAQHHHQGRLRHAEYVELRHAYRPKSTCGDLRGQTRLLAAMAHECRSVMRLGTQLNASVGRIRACGQARCAEAVLDGLGARFEAAVRGMNAVHRAVLARRLPRTCRTALQAPQHVVDEVRSMGQSWRELSAGIGARDLSGYVGSAQRLNATSHRLVATADKPTRALRRLRRCPHA